MTINELAKEVHLNAVAHGWWDGERKAPEIAALIHSEWSEALEEARAGRPLVWHECSGASMLAHEANGCAFTEPNICAEPGPCSWKKPKPEGVAVELIDGCIRILDAFDFFHVSYNEEKTLDELMDEAKKSVLSKSDDISSVIAYLHYETSMLLVSSKYGKIKGMSPATFIIGALGIALSWVREQGLDPLAILLEKHEFNKSRPYKHGKKF